MAFRPCLVYLVHLVRIIIIIIVAESKKSESGAEMEIGWRNSSSEMGWRPVQKIALRGGTCLV